MRNHDVEKKAKTDGRDHENVGMRSQSTFSIVRRVRRKTRSGCAVVERVLGNYQKNSFLQKSSVDHNTSGRE